MRGRAAVHKGSNLPPTQRRHYTHRQPQPVVFTSEPALKLNPTGFVSHHYWARRTLINNLSKACEFYIKHSGADFHFLQVDRLVYRDAASSRATPSPLRTAHTLATIELDFKKKRMWTVLRQDHTNVLESIYAVLQRAAFHWGAVPLYCSLSLLKALQWDHSKAFCSTYSLPTLADSCLLTFTDLFLRLP